MPAAVRARVYQLADLGGGSLVSYAVGEKSVPVGSVPLDVERNGDPESDPRLRRAAIDSRLAVTCDAVDRALVGEVGFSVFGALQGIADEAARAGGNLEAWWSTTVFSGSIDPLVISKLDLGDPQQAVADLLQGPLGKLDLHGVHLHLVLLTPIGPDQRQLTPASELWRATFVAHLAAGLGATVAPPVHDGSTAGPWSNSSSVPPIEPLSDRTPERPSPPDQVVIDNVGFVPDTAILIDPAAAPAKLSRIVEAYQRGRGAQVVTVTGYCAAIGDPNTARALSVQRAQTVAALLRDIGIPDSDIHPDGHGFDQLADPSAPPISAAQRVVIVQLRPIGASIS